MADLTRTTVYPYESYYYQAASADLDGDGLLDLIVTDDSEHLDVFLGQGDAGLSAPTHYALDDGSSLVVADFDGDGRPDVAAPSGGVVTLFLNQGDGRLGAPFEYPYVLSWVTWLGVGDVNGDGRPDLLAASTSQFSLLLNLGDGGIAAPLTLPGPYVFPQAILVSDLNGDGLGDIAVSGFDGEMLVLLTLLDGGFETSVYLGAQWPGSGAFALIPHDGGVPDFAQQASDGQYLQGLHIWRNSGDGHFADGGFYPGPNCAQRIMSADLNGDCIPDLVSSSIDGCSPKVGGGASVMFGRPDGTFDEPVILPTAGTNPTGLALVGPVDSPRGLAIVDQHDAGITLLGDPAR